MWIMSIFESEFERRKAGEIQDPKREDGRLYVNYIDRVSVYTTDGTCPISILRKERASLWIVL